MASIGRNSARSAKLRQNFFDADQRNHRLRQRGGEARVALVFRDGNHAGLGDGKIRAGDADVCRDKFLAQHPARNHRELFGIIRRRAAEFALEQFADFAARQMHRGKNDVIRRFVAKLDDEFAEVVFHDFEAGVFERVVQDGFPRRSSPWT